jgi:hypothetical protein
MSTKGQNLKKKTILAILEVRESSRNMRASNHILDAQNRRQERMLEYTSDWRQTLGLSLLTLRSKYPVTSELLCLLATKFD